MISRIIRGDGSVLKFTTYPVTGGYLEELCRQERQSAAVIKAFKHLRLSNEELRHSFEPIIAFLEAFPQATLQEKWKFIQQLRKQNQNNELRRRI